MRWGRSSEVVLERELNLAHVGAGRRNRAEARDGRFVRASPSGVGCSKLDVIRRVEHLHAELERLALADAEVLHRGEVDVDLPGTAQVIARAVAELGRDGVVERGRVVPGGGGRMIEDRAHAGRAVGAVAVGREYHACRIPRARLGGGATLN